MNTTSSGKSMLVLCLMIMAPALLWAQSSEPKQTKLKLLKGPATAHLSTVAQVELPPGYVFIEGKDYQAMLKAEGEPVSGREMGLLGTTNHAFSVIFEFDDIGYVKDDDKDSLNADKLLDSIKRGTAEANKQRTEAGRPAIEVIGWQIPPKYDEATHNLEWSIRGSVEGKEILNYNTRLLGRRGVMEVVLVVEPERLNDTLPEFRKLLAGYRFQTGGSYAEYRPGDRIAKYGLGALVIGGAAVGAAKLGLLTWLLVFLKKGWKLVAVGIAAIASFFKKLFTRRNSAAADPSETNQI